MSIVLMILGTVAWVWKGYIELGLILCAWAVWFEAVTMNAKLQLKIVPKKDEE